MCQTEMKKTRMLVQLCPSRRSRIAVWSKTEISSWSARLLKMPTWLSVLFDRQKSQDFR